MVKLNEQEKKQQKQESAKKEEIKETKQVPKGHSTSSDKNALKKKSEKIDLTLEDLDVVYFPLVTEKAVNMIDIENKITFVVSDKATKESVRKVIEEAYKVKVAGINIVRDRKGRKKAVVKLTKEFKAQDLATKLGVL
jgi:large subunit ribosomal protein L23